MDAVALDLSTGDRLLQGLIAQLNSITSNPDDGPVIVIGSAGNAKLKGIRIIRLTPTA